MLQNRNIQLNIIELTKAKSGILSDLFDEYNGCCSACFEYWNLHRGITQTSLHHATYRIFRQAYKLPSQLVISARVTAWNRRKITKKIKRVPVRFDNRTFSYKQTPRGNPIICISVPYGRAALPVAQDGTFRRFKQCIREGYFFNSVLLVKRHNRFFLHVVMQKDFPIPRIRPNTIGIDIGSANLCAVTVLDSDKGVVKQLYFGRDVAVRQKQVSIRRSKLQSKADRVSSRAIKGLRRLRHYQFSIVNTRSWQVAHEIVDLAVKYNANINVENLKHLKTGRKIGNSKGRKSNRLINRIPYARFFHALDCIALRSSVLVNRVSPRYTSQTCSRCGFKDKLNRRTVSLFVCKNCGFTCNADRNASRNIANAVVERLCQFSTIPAVVTQRMRLNDLVDARLQHLNQPLTESSTL